MNPLMMLGLLQGALSIGAGFSQERAIWSSADKRTTEIAVERGKELTENAQRAIEQRAAMRAAAAESGINLQSGSFIAALTTSALQQDREAGTIQYNNHVQQRAVWREARAARKAAGFSSLLGGLQIGTAALTKKGT